MRVRPAILFTAVLGACLTGCDIEDIAIGGNSHAYEKEFHQHYPLAAGGRLSVDGFNGSIEISGWDQDKVEVDVLQYGATEQLRDAMTIDVVASGNSVQIRTLRPAAMRGNMGVKYVIKAPKRVNLDRIATSNGPIKVNDIDGTMWLRTSNGAVQAARVRGELDVQTSNGSVDVRAAEGPVTIRTSNGPVTTQGVRGSLTASTSNGGIHARMDDPEPHRPVRLTTSNGGIELTLGSVQDNDVRATTSNGDITLKLPAQAGARIRARTSHSTIHSDFDLRRDSRDDRDGRDRNHLDSVIGSGGPALELTTSNGPIRVLKL
jgi:hypothetical protein